MDPPAGSKPPTNDNNVPTNPSVSNFKPSIVFRIGRKRRCSRHGDEIITPAHHNPGLLATRDNSRQATNELPQLINNTNQSEALNPRMHTPGPTRLLRLKAVDNEVKRKCECFGCRLTD
jgi:hypothetical protein